MEKNYLAPNEIAKYVVSAGEKKIGLKVTNTLILSAIAGAYIALASAGTNNAVHTMTNGSVAKLIAGLLFPIALILILVAGGELFTGNTLTIVGALEKKYPISKVFKNLGLVLIGNGIGAIIVSLLVVKSGQYDISGGLLGGYTIKVAVAKVGLSWDKAFLLGILCNWIVSVAVWMSYAAKDVTGKVIVSFFAIWLFVASAYEHVVANLFYIPAGILAKSNPQYLEKAIAEYGVTVEKLDGLTWMNMITNNIIPVALGNIVGGSLCVGAVYWFVYLKNSEK